MRLYVKRVPEIVYSQQIAWAEILFYITLEYELSTMQISHVYYLTIFQLSKCSIAY